MPQITTCQTTGEEFDVSDLEITLRKKFGFDDLPNTAPWVRFRELGAFWQHWNLHNRKCDKTGKNIISVFSDKCPYPIWHKDEWGKNANPPAQDFDFSKSFFQQAWELFQNCPLPHNTGTGSENCEYTDDWWYSKNCYLSHAGYKTENLKYCYRVIDGKDSHFSVFSNRFELCLDIVNSDDCFNSKYLLSCQNISDAAFLYDCRHCSECMFSFNLRNKKYVFGNVQYSKEEYEKKKNAWNFSSRKKYDQAKKMFVTMVEKHAWLNAEYINRSENSSGNYLKGVNNCLNCYFIDDEEECVNVVRGAAQSKTCLDSIDNSLKGELIYYSLRSLDNCYDNQFCFNTPQSKHMRYSAYCFQCEHCFGCCGLVGKKYYIFNKAYSPEEYEQKKKEIIKHMKKTGEWGKFFPGIFAPNPYDESWASFYWPLSVQQQQKLGFRVSENNEKKNSQYRSPENIPDSVFDIQDEEDLSKKIFWDEKFSRPFKISPADIAFAKKTHSPLPNSYYMNQIQENFSWMPFDGKLRNCKCGQCSAEIKTSWPEKYSGRILCEKCYIQFMY